MIRNSDLEKNLHIIAFDIPYPAVNGRKIDVLHTIIALHQIGIRIHLHCFSYSRVEEIALAKYCASVNYYERSHGHKGFSTHLPYIVSTRKNQTLLSNLLKDDYPILMEGIHSTYLLNDERFSSRKCFVRLHYVAFEYYKSLQLKATSLFKKIYYWNESRLLKKYENNISSKATFFMVKNSDKAIYQNKFNSTKIKTLPPFIPFEEIKSLEGMGTYCLYHGDLSVDANEQAAIWLLKKVFNQFKVPLVIAGNNPSNKLIALAHLHSHTCIVPNPTEKELQDMIAKAHINLLPSFIQTGVKIKLLNAIYNGRHCVVNEAIVAGTELAASCHIATSANAFKEIVAQLYHQPFTLEEIRFREKLILPIYKNHSNALKIAEWIFGI